MIKRGGQHAHDDGDDREHADQGQAGPEGGAAAAGGAGDRALAPRRGEGDVGIHHSGPGRAIDGDRSIDRP